MMQISVAESGNGCQYEYFDIFVSISFFRIVGMSVVCKQYTEYELKICKK